MNIGVIGASGTIGSKIISAFGNEHSLIKLGRNSGDIKIDITDSRSIADAFEQMGKIDALICATGAVTFKPFKELTQEDWSLGINSRLMGQINLVHTALNYLKPNGQQFPQTRFRLAHFQLIKNDFIEDE